MPTITFEIPAKQFASVASRAAISNLSSDEYAKALLLESVAERTATASDIAKTIKVTPETVRAVLSGNRTRVSAETALGIKAMAAEMGYRPTVKDIAAAVRMSPMAVSQTLNNVGRISDESRELIMSTAEKMGWTPSVTAKNLRKRRS